MPAVKPFGSEIGKCGVRSAVELVDVVPCNSLEVSAEIKVLPRHIEVETKRPVRIRISDHGPVISVYGAVTSHINETDVSSVRGSTNILLGSRGLLVCLEYSISLVAIEETVRSAAFAVGNTSSKTSAYHIQANSVWSLVGHFVLNVGSVGAYSPENIAGGEPIAGLHLNSFVFDRSGIDSHGTEASV